MRYLIVVTPSGTQYIYERNGDTMKLLDEIFNREHVALPSPAETAESRAAYVAQALAEAVDPAEYVFPEDDSGVEIRIEGPLDISTTHERLVLDQSVTLHFNGSTEFKVLGKSPFNAFVVLAETEAGQQLWIDLKENSAKGEDSAKYEFIGADNLADIPYIDESAAVLDNPYENTIEGTVDILPIAAEDIDWVLEFGVPGDAWQRTAGVHAGVDFFAPAGTEVVAITSGEVVAVFVPAEVNYEHVFGPSVGSDIADSITPEIAGSIYDPQTVSVRARQWYADDWVVERSQRAYVIVRSGNAFITYGHLDPNSIQVGTHVLAGQPIGTVGKDDLH